MSMRCLFVLWAILLSSCSVHAANEKVSILDAFYRAGQTFLSWKELESVHGERYEIYAHKEPITIENIKNATLLASLREGSAHYRWMSTIDPKLRKHLQKKYPHLFSTIQIHDSNEGSKRLPEHSGLFVRTISRQARTYYAVLPVLAGKRLQEPILDVNSRSQPIEEKIAPIGAVRLARLHPNHFLYILFEDYAALNPTPREEHWDGQAHVIQIRAPETAPASLPLPLELRLHAYTAYSDWDLDRFPPKDRIRLSLLDYHNSWWYGYSDGYRLGMPKLLPIAPKGRVRSFTQRRILQALKWVLAEPSNLPFSAASSRVTLIGQSMGATGAIHMGLRQGGFFASIWSSKGIVNWALPKSKNGWYSNIIRLVGENKGARSLKTLEGQPVFERLNAAKWLAAHPEIETPYLEITHGTIDPVIPFYGVPALYQALEAGRHPYVAGWTMQSHASRLKSGAPMDPSRFSLDESIPAFSNATCNSALKSGFRIMGKAVHVGEKTLKIAEGSLKEKNFDTDHGFFPSGLAGKILVVGAGPNASGTFVIASNTRTQLTIEEGNLLDDPPPLSSYQKKQLEKALGRKATKADLEAARAANLKNFLIMDGAPRGGMNAFFAWSGSGHDFSRKNSADDLVDQEDQWAINIRLEKNKRLGAWPKAYARVDITPRRLQHFRPKPGEVIAWRNVDYSQPNNPKIVEKGEVVVDAWGLVTIPQVLIGKKGWGNRLILSRKN